MPLLLLLIVLIIPASSMAFHDGIELCKDGEMGYIATMLEQGGQIYTFLSREDPPKTDTIVCQIQPNQLIQVKSMSKGL